MERLSQDKIADIWMHHNELRWRILLNTPILAIPVLVGWYSLKIGNLEILSDLCLCVGIAFMCSQYLLLRRMANYAGAYHDALNGKPAVESSWLGIPAHKMAHAIPIMIAIMFVVLAIVELKITSLPVQIRISP